MGFRAKLITSYAAIILVTLLLAVALFAFIIFQIQRDVTNKALDRLQNITNLVSDQIAAQGRFLHLANYQLLLQTDAHLLDVRILLVDIRGKVQADTETDASATMLGQTIKDFKPIPRDNKSVQQSIRLKEVNYFYYARPGLPLAFDVLPPAQGGRQPVALRLTAPADQAMLDTELWLAVPEANLSQGWNDALKGLMGAGLLALAVSIGIALLIARSISQPLIRMTRASTAIAQGHFDQQLPVQGRDEMARLAQSFNQMSQEVSQTQQTMRDFVANVSHELKTPLTSIQGYSQAIVEGVADEPVALHHSANVIYDEAARMRRLVDDLLDLSRIEAGQIELHRQSLELNRVLQHIVIRLTPMATARQLQFQTRLEPDLTVQGDADRLVQVFTNLLDNALKYSREGGVVWLEARKVTEQPASNEANRNQKAARPEVVSVRIANVGPLIQPDQLPRIFERFFMVDRSRKRQGESSGLGLAIARELIEAHQGTITASSDPTGQPNEGYTVFTITLPFTGQTNPAPGNPGLVKSKIN